LNGIIKLHLLIEENFSCETRFLQFRVIDSGVGIKEEDQKKLFTPFQKGSHSNNHMGSGLGLFIAQEISSKLGTGLQFISSESKGSSFFFGIPFVNSNENIMIEYSFDSRESKLTNKIDNIEKLIVSKNYIGFNDINHFYSQSSSRLNTDNNQIQLDSSRNLIKDEYYEYEGEFTTKIYDSTQILTIKEFFLESYSNLCKSLLK
jgi:hypothetical protein